MEKTAPKIVAETATGKPVYGSVSWMTAERVLHIDESPHGVYHVEDQGAGVHGTYFRTHRAKRLQYIGTANCVDGAKRHIARHAARLASENASETRNMRKVAATEGK